MAEFLTKSEGEDVAAISRAAMVGFHIERDDVENRNLRMSTKNLLRLAENNKSPKKAVPLKQAAERAEDKFERPTLEVEHSLRNLEKPDLFVRTGSNISNWFQRSMRSFHEDAEDDSKDTITRVRVFPDGTVLADGMVLRAKVAIQQALQLLALSQQQGQEVLIGTKSCPPMVGYRCKCSVSGAKKAFMQHLSQGGYGTIEAVADNHHTCTVRWDRTGAVHDHKTGYVLPKANIGITFQRLTQHVWQVIRLDGPIGPKDMPLYTPPRLGDRLIAVDGKPLALFTHHEDDAFRGAVGTHVALTFTDDWGRWVVTVERQPLDDEGHDEMEVHPKAEYDLALGAKELADGSGEVGMRKTTWKEFCHEGLHMHGANVRIKQGQDGGKTMEVLLPMKPPELAALGLGFNTAVLRSFFTAEVEEEGGEEAAQENHDDVDWEEFVKLKMKDDPKVPNNQWVIQTVENMSKDFWTTITNALSPEHLVNEEQQKKAHLSGDRTKQIQKYVSELGISKELMLKLMGRSQREQVEMLEKIRDLRESAKADATKARVQEMSALHQAVLRDDVDTAIRLMGQGVPAETQSPQGEHLTALQTAVKCGNLQMVEAMVAQGKAKVNYCEGGSWPMEMQLRKTFNKKVKVEREIEKCKVEGRELAVLGRNFQDVQNKEADLTRDRILLEEEMRELLEKKIKLEASHLDVNCRSPLALACLCKNPGMIQLLMDLGAETEVGLPVADTVLASLKKNRTFQRLSSTELAKVQVDTLHDWCKRSFPLGMLLLEGKVRLEGPQRFMRRPLFAVFLNWASTVFEHHHQQQDPAAAHHTQNLFGRSPSAGFARTQSAVSQRMAAKEHKAKMLYRISSSSNNLYGQVQSSPYGISFPQLRHGVDEMKFPDQVWVGRQEQEHFVKGEGQSQSRGSAGRSKASRRKTEAGRHVSHRILRTLFVASTDPAKREAWTAAEAHHEHHHSVHEHIDHRVEIGYEEFQWIISTLCDTVLGMGTADFAHVAMAKMEVAGVGDVAWSEASSEVSSESHSDSDGEEGQEARPEEAPHKMHNWRQGEANLQIVARFVDNPNLLQGLLGSWVRREEVEAGEPANHLGERAKLFHSQVKTVQFNQDLHSMHAQEVARQCGAGGHVWDKDAAAARAPKPLHSALLHQYNLKRRPKDEEGFKFDSTGDGREHQRFRQDANEKRFMQETAHEKREKELLAPVVEYDSLVERWQHRWLTIAKRDPRTGDPYKYGGEDGRTTEPLIDFSKRPPTLNVFNNLATVTATDQNHAIHSFFG